MAMAAGAASIGPAPYIPIRNCLSTSSTASPPPPSSSPSSSVSKSHPEQSSEISSPAGSGTSQRQKRPSLADQLRPHSEDFLDGSTPPRLWTSPSRRKARDFASGRNKSLPGTVRYGSSVVNNVLRLLENAEESEESIVAALDGVDNLNSKDIVAILSSVRHWRKANLFFNWLKSKSFNLNVFCYNVMLNVLRKAELWEMGKDLMDEMPKSGVSPDNVTYSTIISFAVRCGKTSEALQLFTRMQEAGCSPDVVTYCAVIEVLAKSGRMQEAVDLCSKMQEEVVPLDAVAYSQIIKLHGMQRNYKKMMEVYSDMLAAKIIPNVVTYNSMISLLGTAGRSRQVKQLFSDLLSHGLKPSPITLSLLFRAFTKSRNFNDAYEVFEKISAEGWAVDAVVYNSMLTICAQFGKIEEGEKVFNELLNSKTCKPDDWTWRILVDMYVKGGKVEEGRRITKQMVSKGQKIDIPVYMALIHGYSKLKDFSGVVELFDEAHALYASLDHKMAGALLSAFVMCEEVGHEEGSAILERIGLVYPKLRYFIENLCQEDYTQENMKKDALAMLSGASEECRQPFCNLLMDLCWVKSMADRAHHVLAFAVACGVYKELQSRSPIEWCLKLRTLSFGAARAALQSWISSLRSTLQQGSELPPVLSIEVGVGSHTTFDESAPVMSTFILRSLKEMNAPFEESRSGWLAANASDVKAWLSSADATGSK